jgi:prepilin-type N-terminal cleavage/methylation domain-containing protein
MDSSFRWNDVQAGATHITKICHSARQQIQSGYTLVEIAVVLLISSVIAATSFTLGTAWIEAEEYTAAKRQMTAIENAFETYRRLNLRLPCPADMTPALSADIGYEGGTGPGDCDAGGGDAATLVASSHTFYGALPVKALSLPVSLMRDPWGQYYVYFVDQYATEEGAFDIMPQSSDHYIDPNFDSGNGRLRADGTSEAGEITVYGSGGSTRTDRALFALLSYGKNGYGGVNRNGSFVTNTNPAPGNDELINADPNSLALVQRLRNFTTGADYFDDIVLYKNRWHLREDVRPGETVGE